MCGLGILLELMTNICDERGLGDLGKRLMLRFEPTGEIEEIIRPADLSSLLVAHAMRGSAGRHGRLINHGELHRRPQPHCSSNCLTLSRSKAASRRAVLRTGGREELERQAWAGSGGEE